MEKRGLNMGMYHSCCALPALVILILSTAFLIWVGGKAGNPYEKLGRFVGWVAVILSALMLIFSAVMCIGTRLGCPMCSRMSGGMEQPGPGMQMPGMQMPGMRLHMGPGMGMMPPAPAEKPAPENK